MKVSFDTVFSSLKLLVSSLDLLRASVSKLIYRLTTYLLLKKAIANDQIHQVLFIASKPVIYFKVSLVGYKVSLFT